MKKYSEILSLASIILSIISCVLCIVTLTVVLRSTAAAGSGQTVQQPVQSVVDNGNKPGIEKVQDVRVLLPENGTDWHFEFPLYNDTDSELRLRSVVIYDYMGGVDGETLDEYVIDGSRLEEINLPLMLAPGEEKYWDDWHPVVDFFDARAYSFIYEMNSGEQVAFVYPFELSDEGFVGNIDYSADEGKDLITLRYDATFEVEVAPGVFWVSARTLGDSDFTNSQIHGMIGISPEEKQSEIDTVYEAMQLYQVSNFIASDDNIRISENGINWEHHKPGYYAVLTNNGCCATSANWLNYILRDDYDEVGYIATSQRDGNGHIFNYIKQDGWYYIIDMTHYRTDWIATARETGDLNDYYSTDFIAGNIHKVQNIGDYVNYVQAEYGDPPDLCSNIWQTIAWPLTACMSRTELQSYMRKRTA